MSRSALAATVAVALFSVHPRAAAADGVSVRGRASRSDVIDRAAIVFAGKVFRVGHEYAARAPYGRKVRYIARYRLLVRVDDVVRGEEALARALGNHKKLWVEMRNPVVPGRRVVLEQYYGSGPRLEQTKRGDTLVVYLHDASAISDGKSGFVAELLEVDEGTSLPAVREAIADADRAARARLRQSAPTCKQVDTFVHDGACRAVDAIVGMIECADGQRATSELGRAGSLTISCVDADGKAQGARRRWSRDGELSATETLRDGKLDGPWSSFYPGGAARLTGSYDAGKKHGTWRRYGDDGSELGSYEMDRGTGVETTWNDAGWKSGEHEYAGGLRHGTETVYHQDGTPAMTGTYRRGKAHGRWLYFNADGKVRLGSCERRGKTVWETEDAEAARTRRCK